MAKVLGHVWSVSDVSLENVMCCGALITLSDSEINFSGAKREREGVRERMERKRERMRKCVR